MMQESQQTRCPPPKSKIMEKFHHQLWSDGEKSYYHRPLATLRVPHITFQARKTTKFIFRANDQRASLNVSTYKLSSLTNPIGC